MHMWAVVRVATRCSATRMTGSGQARSAAGYGWLQVGIGSIRSHNKPRVLDRLPQQPSFTSLFTMPVHLALRTPQSSNYGSLNRSQPANAIAPVDHQSITNSMMLTWTQSTATCTWMLTKPPRAPFTATNAQLLQGIDEINKIVLAFRSAQCQTYHTMIMSIRPRDGSLQLQPSFFFTTIVTVVLMGS